MVATIGGRLEGSAPVLVGRAAEQATLRQLVADDTPLVVFIHGIGGVGKSALVAAFCAEARAGGATVLRVDGGSTEPTEPGFLAALAAAAGAESSSLSALTTRLARLGPRVVVAVDGYELLRPIDPWLRQVLVPALPAAVRLILAGREPPLIGWRAAFGDLFRGLPLANLSADDARDLLGQAGIGTAEADRINRLARGHPLSLRLAASAVLEARPPDVEAATMNALVEGLTELYLAGLDQQTRMALEATAVVRRPTLSLLAAMLPEAAPQDSFERLRSLPFVDLGPDGLILHDTVREVVARYLRAADPERARRYRAAAWRQLRDEVARASRQEMWRYTADLLYLLENPMIREAFFPTTEHRCFVDAARTEDLPAITAIAAASEPPASVAILRSWWQRFRDGFRLARDASGVVVGFYVVAELRDLSHSLLEQDVVARLCRDDLRRRPVPSGQRALIERFEIASGPGADASLVQAALVLDLKRLYMELRPELRRIYTIDREGVTPGSPWARLGFEPVSRRPVELDGVAYHAAALDFGPASVDGWLARLIAAELGVEETGLLDMTQRQLVLDTGRVDLTRLEFEVFSYLYQRQDRVVDRTSLLRDVWGYDEDDAGSNVIEAVIRSLRRKLGERATAIETVRGVGYRFRERPSPR